MEEIVGKLPQGVGFEWQGLSYQEKMSSSQAPLLYAFSVLVIFSLRGSPVRKLAHTHCQYAHAASGVIRCGTCHLGARSAQ